MKGPISIGLGRFLNAYGIREPVQFEGFENGIRTQMEIEKYFTRANSIHLDGQFDVAAQGRTVGGTVPAVPEGELWLVESAYVEVITGAAQTVNLRPFIASTLAGIIDRSAPVPFANQSVPVNTSIIIPSGAPFLMSPGEQIGAYVSSITGGPFAVFAHMQVWRMVLG